MTEEQISIFFDYIGQNYGKVEALHRAGSSLDEFDADIRVNPGFRARWREALVDRRDWAERTLLAAARGDPIAGADVAAAVAYLKVTIDREQLKLAKAKHKFVAAKPGAGGEPAEASENYRLLDDEQWEIYFALTERLAEGQRLAPRELETYGYLTSITMGGGPPALTYHDGTGTDG